MRRVTTISQLHRALDKLPGSIAFVPTMGFLHDGHLALMRHGLTRADHLVVSVFVNPTQFGPDEDLEAYPRDLDGDADQCRDVGCDIFFSPSRDEIYGDDHCTRINVDRLDSHLCGVDRPGHFQGVATIVTKLFNIIDPDVAVFGQKDRQQLAIIRRLVRDLNFAIDVDGVPTVREDDGLALSSRNRYLDDDQRRQATSLSRGLVAAHRAFDEDPQMSCAQLLEAARAPVEDQPDARIDYAECVRPHSLTPCCPDEPVGEAGAIIAIAAHIGPARLIDNLRIDRPLPEGPLRSLP